MSVPVVTHKFVSQLGDPADPKSIGQTYWNQDHVISLTALGLVGTSAPAGGPAEIIAVGDGLDLSGNVLSLIRPSLVSVGGTGNDSLGLNGVLFGNGTSPIGWAINSTSTKQFLTQINAEVPLLAAILSADVPPIDLASSGNGGVTGNLPTSHLNSGTGASGTTFWRGDGSWAVLSSVGAGLTSGNDTNVTLTLGGAPSAAVLAATSITVGWAGVLSVSRGGTGAATQPPNLVFAGPTSGGSAPPSFRALVAADIPQTAISLANESGGSVIPGQAVYINGSGTFALAVASAYSTGGAVGLLLASATNHGLVQVLVFGSIVLTTGQWDAVAGTSGGLSPGTLYFLSPTTPGSITSAPPTAAGQVVEPVGRAISPTQMVLNIGLPLLL